MNVAVIHLHLLTIQMQYSIISILVLTTAIAFEFQSRFTLNIGISVTFFMLLISVPTVHSMWPQRLILGKSDLRILNFCVMATTCAVFNAVLIAFILMLTELPNRLA